ncbi:MAG: aldehyde dehydrogenase family protein [Phycisphaerales bacterium]|nr:aldehyde dehydrogenase family protein [Phycisphaerales bacterium]
MALFFKSKKPKVATPQSAATATATRNLEGRGIAAPDPAVESRAFEIGSDFLDRARKAKVGVLAVWSEGLMDWAMQDEAFKVQLFRFVDCFPTLKDNDAVYDHLTDYLSQPGVTPPPFVATALKAGFIAKGLVTKTMSGQITSMASKFIAGTDAQDALPALQKIWDSGLCFSVDLLGESCVSDEEATAYRQKYLDLVVNLPTQVASWKSNPRLDNDHLGRIPRTNVSIKISSLSARVDPIDTEGSVRSLLESLDPILRAAKERGVLVNFDMEQFALKDLTLELFMRACEAHDFEAGLAMQAYLRSGDEDAQRIIAWSKRTGRRVTVRLVKGAYWDCETINSEQQGWPIPVWGRKCDTDASFERMASAFIASTPKSTSEGGVKLALGSHNARSIAAALAALEKRGLPRNAIELQMLHGMGDQLKLAAIELDLRLREYVPVGELIPGMAYLVRRLLENSSNESWLKAGFKDNASVESLLASPHREFDSDPGIERILRAPEKHKLSAAHASIGDGKPFYTEPMRNFALSSTRDAFKSAMQQAKVPVVENSGTLADVVRVVGVAHAAFPAWRDSAYITRAAVLTNAARELRERRDALSAVIVKESGKVWREADADVCEAIDFCEYYAREGARLFESERLGAFVGELDEQWYQPRGVSVVIAPWNFPLAICCGMAVAALVTGNTVIVKPAEQTPAIARMLCEILWRAGAPKDCLHFLAGNGETVGAALVRDPRVALIAFTGSKAVGLDIVKAAGIVVEGQEFVKKVVCEMGGKNAIIVDSSADLDEAVIAVRQSAFGFCGQKCSACSRVIVVGSAYTPFLHRLVEATRALVVGDPSNPSTDIGPVIDQDSARKIRSYIEIGKGEAKHELTLPIPEGLEAKVGLPYVGPTIFSGVKPEHRIAREEIFGPLLAVLPAKDFEEALKMANSPEYKLTGGVFSRRPAHLTKARREFRVGNLYLNRGITGALVGRQPFGGFGMSGLGSKAGGRDYLLNFVEPRAVCENTMRRGFAPGLE